MAGSSAKPELGGPINIRAVARRAGVSTATVSRTFNKNPTVNPRLAKKVWDAIHLLGYLPNNQAQALVSGRSRILGLIVSDITNPFFPELIQGFEDMAVESGYEILVSSTNYDEIRMELCILRMMQRKVEGVAVMTFGIDQPSLQKLYDCNVPLAFVDAGPERTNTTVVSIDYHHGIRQGVQHLAALGHRKIGFVTGPLSLISAQVRVLAFKNAIAECGIELREQWLVQGDHSCAGGMRAMSQILVLSQRPTALMCSNDLTAIGVLHEANHIGIRIPDEMSVIGFDDIQPAQMMIPPLTSIQMSRTALARAAVFGLRDSVEGRQRRRERKIETLLVVRKSTGFPPGTLKSLRPAR